MVNVVDEVLGKLSKSWTDDQWADYFEYEAAFDFKRQQTQFAHLVRSTRQSQDLSQRKLAKMANIQQRELSKIETAQGNPTAQTRFRLLTALGLEETYTVTPRAAIQTTGGKTRAKKAQTQSIIA
jgi:ribosome-binding protein aMBF1 (putative translation factor)